jgi:hypothetical protein
LSLQRCEGKNLESVLEEVRNRFGDTVTIVEANRLRKGGVGGFFSKERFEVVVDIDDDEGSASAGSPHGLTELPAEFGLEATESFCERLLSMADGVNDAGEPARTAPAAPSVSTEQPQFAAVLDSISRHMEANTAAAPPPVHASLSVPPAPAEIGPRPVAAPAAAYEMLAAAPMPAPVRPAAAVPVETSVDARALARIGLPEDIRRAAITNPAPAAGADPSAWLLGLLEHLPVPDGLPQGQGSVIVVAGGREAALLLARQIADELQLDPDALLIASNTYKGRTIPFERRITTVEMAAESRRSWRRRLRPTIVVVDAPTGPSGDWARRVIDALEPTMVWGAVEATRKPDDLFDWAEQLGGFDALGVTDLDGTVSPAAVLQCGIPVGRIDGRPATPSLWVSLLAPRLAA